mmetsp:Transcript_23085/g.50114  ORF Transcript_23085/g.50114 Transcript_23085/m.50114 type:complete len:330 (-) Transcript_23085:318-1307(-)
MSPRQFPLIRAVLVALLFSCVYFSKTLQSDVVLFISPGHSQPKGCVENLSRINRDVGSWIGNTWIPPKGQKYYSAGELKDIFNDISVLWIGDSTGRRSALSMYGIINATSALGSDPQHISIEEVDSPSVIDTNRRSVTESCQKWKNDTFGHIICRAMPPGSKGRKEFLIVPLACLKGTKKFLHSEIAVPKITRNVDLIVVAQGIWEAVRAHDCHDPNSNFTTIQDDVIALLAVLSKSTRVVWRTSGFDAREGYKAHTLSMNRRAMDAIDYFDLPNFTYVDWGGAILPRCFGKDRISGDIKPHHGFEPRLVLIQMITNVVHQQHLACHNS